MKITNAYVNVTSPGRNFVTLKVETDEGIYGLGDGTLNGLQPLAERLPTVLAPKTIDNDLGLNYPSEPDEWVRTHDVTAPHGYRYERADSNVMFDLNQIVNYATPGYATAVMVTTQGIYRVRTTAESHRRIAIIEVMGRNSGYIALGSAYGQPDIILIPEVPLNMERLVERVRYLYDLTDCHSGGRIGAGSHREKLALAALCPCVGDSGTCHGPCVTRCLVLFGEGEVVAGERSELLSFDPDVLG